MTIQDKNGKAFLLIKENATIKDYESVLNRLVTELKLDDLHEVNDFDSYYHSFIYNNHKMVISYHNSLGINLFFFDDFDLDKQINLLHELMNRFTFISWDTA